MLPPDECSYVFGNPPFGGAKFQSPEQRAQVRRVADLGGSGGTLDYVAAWFIRAGDYVRPTQPSDGVKPARIGFVATNTITQGEQVAQLWPLLLDRRRLDIAFAHRTFAWGSDARGKAHVHVVIIGLDAADQAPRERHLLAYGDINGEPLEGRHDVITPYLFDGGALINPHLVVHEEAHALNGMSRLYTGSQPIDGGHYILDDDGRDALLDECPAAEPYVRPFVGSQEYLNGRSRWLLWLGEAPLELLRNAPSLRERNAPSLRERIAAVRELRRRSKGTSTRALADTPTLFQNLIPTAPFLVVPEVSSERREYVPIGWLEPPVIPSNLVRVLEGASKSIFAGCGSSSSTAPGASCERHGKSYLTCRRRGGEGGGGGLLTGSAIPSAYRWAWFRWYSRVVEVPLRFEVAAGFVAPGALEPPRLQPSWRRRRIRTRAWMKQGYCVAPACTSELHPVADQVPHAPSMTPVAMEHRHRLADVLGHVDEVDYHTVRSTAALARSSRVSAPSTSATHPGAQPAPSRRSSPGGVPADAAASARHRRPPRPDRRPPPGCVDRGVLAGACASTPSPSVQLPFELALTHLLGFAR